MNSELVAAAVVGAEELVQHRVMTMWEWADSHWFIFFLLASLALVLAALLAENSLGLFRRVLRTVIISFRGYPPPYLDADGDHVEMVVEKERTRQEEQRIRQKEERK